MNGSYLPSYSYVIFHDSNPGGMGRGSASFLVVANLEKVEMKMCPRQFVIGGSQRE